MRAHRDLLRPQDFLNRLGPPGSGLDRRIVGDHDNFPSADQPDAGNNSRGRRHADLVRALLSAFLLLPAAFYSVLIVSNQQTDLLLERFFVEQRIDPFSSRELALLMLLLNSVRAATETQLCFQLAQLRRQFAQP